MLSKELCRILGVDKFSERIVDEMESIENKVKNDNGRLSPEEKIKLKKRYIQLYHLRDAYSNMINAKLNRMAN